MTAVLVILLLLLAGFLIYALAVGPKLPANTDSILDRVLGADLPEVVSGKTGFASAGQLKIWYESISPEGPLKGTVLLISALGGHALEWSPTIVRSIVQAGYQVIRYDQRGTGLSDWIPGWNRKDPYSITDMAGDVLAILDLLEVQKTHIVGLSMGGMIAQEVAIQHPERVASLVLLMTSGFIGDPDLPGPGPRFFLTSIVNGVLLLKYHVMGGEKNLIRERILKQISAGGLEGLDIQEMAEVFLYDLRKRRGTNIRAIFQHQTAVLISGSRYEKLKTLTMPTLVIHGTADPLIPVEHGKKLVEAIPNARGLWLEGVGHVFPVPDMDLLMKSIVSHLEDHQFPSASPTDNPG